MKKTVWVICDKKQDMMMAQKCINKSGSMRASCIVSGEVLSHKMEECLAQDMDMAPSLILLDYAMYEAHNEVLEILQHPQFLGIPFFFMTDEKTRETDEICYDLGATVVLKKPLSNTSFKRIEQAAKAHAMTKAYELTVKRQTDQLRMAKEIARLNEQLKSRNELLYRIFGKYFSDEVVEVILENPQGANLGGQRSNVTVMIADLRGFTSLSDQLPAETVVDMINHFLGEMTEIIRRHHGTVIEFMGDGILSVFGAPIFCERSEEEAIIAAIEMQNQMSEVNRYGQTKGYPEIEMGIGLHSGEVFIGNIGSENLMRYNVIGQAVNLCSRIESYSVGGQILLSQDTMIKINRPMKYNQETEISVKGVAKPVKIYEILMIEADQIYELSAKNERELTFCEDPCEIWVRPLLEKRVLDQVVRRRVKAIGERYILFERDYSRQEIKLYQNIEMATKENATKFAYAKVVELTEEGILTRITFMPDDFWK